MFPLHELYFIHRLPLRLCGRPWGVGATRKGVTGHPAIPRTGELGICDWAERPGVWDDPAVIQRDHRVVEETPRRQNARVGGVPKENRPLFSFASLPATANPSRSLVEQPPSIPRKGEERSGFSLVDKSGNGYENERAVPINFDDSCTYIGATKHLIEGWKKREGANKTKGIPPKRTKKKRGKNPNYNA